ncbi:MAG: hypothetical protein KGM42_17175 [Hyphomicrobiales bacterium]|nr:hypothetical protein [Hyphomicrobiales bacterium]
MRTKLVATLAFTAIAASYGAARAQAAHYGPVYRAAPYETDVIFAPGPMIAPGATYFYGPGWRQDNDAAFSSPQSPWFGTGRSQGAGVPDGM